MERIAGELTRRVQAAIRIGTILDNSPAEAARIINECRSVLRSWERTYFSVRKRMNSSSTGQPWEFDRRRLFGQSKYMEGVCEDLIEVRELPRAPSPPSQLHTLQLSPSPAHPRLPPACPR